jgi:4a-hydroxytetrahydrobiopterin dehydratase|tara:strand:+ start:1425 stop:1718 length:294 start_codon:yes stop_codon:yes gene_type:complete
MREKLTGTARVSALQTLPGWQEVEGRNAVEKAFRFASFSEAWAFMSRVALLAEKLDHHPEWFNVYNRVKVQLTTHDCDGVSDLDIEMAQAINRFAEQ